MPRTAVETSIEENETDTGEIFDPALNPTIPADASITGNEDRALFEIDDTTGELKFKTAAAPNFEDPKDDAASEQRVSRFWWSRRPQGGEPP